MNVKTFVFANSRKASITHALNAHADHSGSKAVQHLNALLYPRRCLYSKTTYHMLKLSANVSKLLRSTTHVHACSFCCPVYVRLHGIRSMWLQWLASCPWYMCVVCACVYHVLCSFLESTCEYLQVCPSLKIATVSSLRL